MLFKLPSEIKPAVSSHEWPSVQRARSSSREQNLACIRGVIRGGECERITLLLMWRVYALLKRRPKPAVPGTATRVVPKLTQAHIPSSAGIGLGVTPSAVVRLEQYSTSELYRYKSRYDALPTSVTDTLRAGSLRIECKFLGPCMDALHRKGLETDKTICRLLVWAGGQVRSVSCRIPIHPLVVAVVARRRYKPTNDQ
ncbi:hypothetical protein KEM48_014563 [Puccinia striiformis f. sp. tritici PST-130]|uniref:Uncharacterized protein n=2 Tax=Puccinia striiformis TaxID=27350 RepID=A0A0L0VWR8_9BASI|nr:hypothetical protein KEM48_014563 [Puccinia striiformis f. sp. tritici PST-130]KNF03713.1 hypothetical protein PSTG_03235 [Puccinia striiformis f. sp. tritici PST-78]POW14418.1 hypothetical protein PSTT_02875 [Puccinia striiformis]